MSLAETNRTLGPKGTDKGDAAHSFCGKSNLDIYEPLFCSWRKHSFDLIEIGVRDGGSMRLWSSYFPNARIHGIDIDPACAGLQVSRVSVTIGSQDDLGLLATVAKSCRDLRLVIDDGSHLLSHMLMTHKALWPSLSPKGIYIFEDVAITRHGVDLGWPGMRYNKQPFNEIPRLHLDQFILETLLGMDRRQGDVASLSAYYNLLILQKA